MTSYPDRDSSRFTFTPDGEGKYRLRCIGCTDPLGSWDAEQAPLLHAPAGQTHLREIAAAHDRATHPGADVPATPLITPGETLAPATWCIRYGLTLMSRDGWRRGGAKPFADPVDLPEFAYRARLCTQDLAAWERFITAVPRSARTAPEWGRGPDLWSRCVETLRRPGADEPADEVHVSTSTMCQLQRSFTGPGAYPPIKVLFDVPVTVDEAVPDGFLRVWIDGRSADFRLDANEAPSSATGAGSGKRE